MLTNKDALHITCRGVVGILLILIFAGLKSRDKNPDKMLLESCNAFRRIQEDVRDYLISPDSARIAFQAVMRNIQAGFTRDSCKTIDSTHFVYPVRHYWPRESIGGRGAGFRPEGFDLFDATVRGSHPAHDIFVRDKNQDNIDDRTWKPVDVLSFSSGIVVATETNWKADSDRRGGNWIWIYDPCLDGLFYYAHNNVVLVQPGQWVNAGDKISEMGRSGFSAYKKRSPTHLHFMFLKLNSEALPEPYDTYDWMMRASVKE